MNEKKGFTLVELLAAVVVAGLLLAIIIPSIRSMMNNSKDKLYDTEIAQIERAARAYVIKYVNEITNFETNGIGFVTINELSDKGYIDTPIKNPKTGENFNGDYVVKVTKKENGVYTFKFLNTIAPAEIIPPVITFNPTGNTTYAKTRSVTVTVTDNASVDTSSLKYQWNTSTAEPTGGFTSSFTNGGTISSPAGITGSYYLWVSASDTSGNVTIEKTNIFNFDNTGPVITLNGSNPAVVNVGGSYTDAGATAIDNINGNITGSITSTNNVNTSVEGTYTVTYNVSDSLGNTSTTTRTVNVTSGYYYTASNKLPVFGVGGGDYPPSGWTGLQNANDDDAYKSVSLPFSIKIFGTSYSTVYVGSNSYLTFGSGSTEYSDFSASNPSYDKILFGSADNSYQRVSYYSSTNYVRIRYEGTSSTSGTVGSPNIVAEFTIFNPDHTAGGVTMIEMLIGNHNRLSGAKMIANASGSVSVPYTLAASTSYIFLGDNTGNNFQVFSSSKTTGVDY